jgi:hypothetical protein
MKKKSLIRSLKPFPSRTFRFSCSSSKRTKRKKNRFPWLPTTDLLKDVCSPEILELLVLTRELSLLIKVLTRKL